MLNALYLETGFIPEVNRSKLQKTNVFLATVQLINELPMKAEA